MTTMIKKATPLPLRNDTILGVCEAIGQDFGFNPLWLRLAFIGPLFWQPAYTFAAYVLLGAVVAVSRYFFPRAVQTDTVDAIVTATHDNQEERLPIAA